MNTNKSAAIKKRIMKVGENLKKNNMEFYFAESAGDVKGIVESLMNDGDTVSHGGSVSMDECCIRDLLNSGKSSRRTILKPSLVKNFSILISTSNGLPWLLIAKYL